MILVSACLAGEKCRYNGEALRCEAVAELVASGRAIAVCPEVLGGLPVPRPPAEIVAGRVLTRGGADVTEQFHSGALIGLELARQAGCGSSVLKVKPGINCSTLRAIPKNHRRLPNENRRLER